VLLRVFYVSNKNVHQNGNSFTSQTYECGGAKSRPFGVRGFWRPLNAGEGKACVHFDGIPTGQALCDRRQRHNLSNDESVMLIR